MTVKPSPQLTLRRTLIHTLVITRRNLLRNIRLPQLLVFATIQPVMFLVLFDFLFGGAITQGGPAAATGAHINWLIPGILVQSAVFAAKQADSPRGDPA